MPASTPVPPPPPPPRRRQRLEDLVISYSSNYYAAYPCQSSAPSSESSESPLQSTRRIYQQSEDTGIYCDLFNLLELPSSSPPPVKSRKKYTLIDHHPRRRHPSVSFRNAHGKVKDISERKRHHHQAPSSSYKKEKKREEDELPSAHHYDRLKENTKTNDCIYQQHSTSKGFFRRVARNYFCMPMTVANAEFSN